MWVCWERAEGAEDVVAMSAVGEHCHYGVVGHSGEAGVGQFQVISGQVHGWVWESGLLDVGLL